MNGRVDTERILDAYLAPESDRLPDRVIDAALAEIARIPQRRALRVPWRFPQMPAAYRAVTLAAVLVAVVGAAALYIRGNTPGYGGGPPPSPTPSATTTPTTLPSAPPTMPPLTATFTSPRYGYSIDYPTGWTLTPAAELIDPESFAAGGEGDWFDELAPSQGDGLLRMASVPVPDGVNASEWIAQIYLSCTGTCFEGLTESVIDGQPALIRKDNLEREMIVIVGKRAYFATLFPGPSVGLPYAPELFDAFMATLDLRPQDAEVWASPAAT